MDGAWHGTAQRGRARGGGGGDRAVWPGPGGGGGDRRQGRGRSMDRYPDWGTREWGARPLRQAHLHRQHHEAQALPLGHRGRRLSTGVGLHRGT